MREIVRKAVFAAVAVAVAGCASSPSSGATAGTAASASGTATARRDMNVLRRSEVSEAQLNLTAFEVIQQLRPQFLSGMSGGLSNAGLWVYMDGSQLGRSSELRNIRMREVEEIRYLSGSEATNRYGTGHSGGALVIRRRR